METDDTNGDSIFCIFCRRHRPPTKEHVVPEFLGGALVIEEVCKECNDRMGSDFEGPISRSILFRLFRFTCDVQGKSSTPIHPFPATAVAENGQRFRLDADLKPRLLARMQETKLESGEVQLELDVDASDADKIPHILEEKIRRIAARDWPALSSEDVNNIVQKVLSELPETHEVRQQKPSLSYREVIDLNHLVLLMCKVAYEVAYHHHGAGVIADDCHSQLCKALNKRSVTDSEVKVSLWPTVALPFFNARKDCHHLVLMRNICYLKLSDVTAIVEVCEAGSEYDLPPEKWAVYSFNYRERSWEKKNFLEYVAEGIGMDPNA